MDTDSDASRVGLRPWAVGVVVAVAVGAVTVFSGVRPRLGGICGLVWGIVAWTATGYPDEYSLSFHGLEGRDRWLAGTSLVLVACAFATVGVLPVEGRTAYVLYAEALGLCIGLSTLGALIETHN